MKRGTESRVFLGKDTSIDEFSGLNVLSTVLLGKKEGGFQDHGGLYIVNNVTLGKGIAHIIAQVVFGVPPLSLPNAASAAIPSLTAFGGTEHKPETYIDEVTADGLCMQKNLPDGYTELEYATFNGTQVVDTGLQISTNDEIRSKLEATAVGFAYGADTSNPRVTLYMSSGGNQRWGTGVSSVSGFPPSGVVAIVQNKTAISYNGEAKSFSETDDFTTINNLTIGNCNGNTTTPKFSGNFYYMQILKDEIMVANLVAAKNSSNVVGFYDTIRKTFYAPSTGTLVAGPEIPRLPQGYTLLDGITGDGNAYIDLACALDQDDEIEIDFTMPATAINSKNIFGFRNGASLNNISVMIASTDNNMLVEDFNNSNYSTYRLVSTNALSASTKYAVIMNKTGRYVYQGSTLVDSNTTACADTITTTNSYLFNIAGYPAYANKFNGAINRCVIKGKRYLVPCKNASNEVGMYDTINGVFYGAVAETGEFTAGNTVATVSPDRPANIWCNNGVLKANENLITGNLTQGIYNDGVLSPSVATWVAYDTAIPVENGKTYTLNAKPSVPGKTIEQNVVKYLDGVYVGYTALDGVPYTFTPDSTYNQVKLQFAYQPRENTTPSNIINVQLYQNGVYADGTQETITDAVNTTATAQMLLSVGEYKDTQAVVSGTVTRNVGIKVLDGTENWTQLSDNRGYFTAIAGLSGLPMSSSLTGFSTHFPYYYWEPPQSTDRPMQGVNVFGYNGSVSGTNGNLTIKPDLTVYNTVEKWTTWLAQQYAAGTPVIIVYPLATATTESVAGQQLIKAPVTYTGALPDLTGTTAESSHTVPNPAQPLDINTNNGVLKWDDVNQSIYTDGTVETIAIKDDQNTTVSTATCEDLLGLNPAYTELGYIQTTGTQYIDTDIKPDEDYDVEVVFTTPDALGNGSLFGNQSADVLLYLSSSTFSVYNNNVNKGALTPNVSTNTKYSTKLSVVDTTATISGDFTGTFSDLTISGTRNILLGANFSSTVTDYGKFKYHSVRITKGGVLVRNLIPAKRNSDNASGMYDTVSETFFANAGTGTFIDGAKVRNFGYAYQDNQDVISGNVTRNIGIKVLDGTENYTLNGGYISISKNTYFPDAYLPSQSMNITSTHFLAGGASSTNTIYVGGANLNFTVTGTFTTTTAWTTWLAAQYAAGTPVIVIYPLATSATETVTAQPMETVEGDNVVEIAQASIDGLELSVTYMKRP